MTAIARFVLCIVFPLQKSCLLHLTAPAFFCSGQGRNGLSTTAGRPGLGHRQNPETGERVNEKSADAASARRFMGPCDPSPTPMMMPVPTMVAAKEVPRAPEAGVGIAMTVGPVVVSLFINPRGVVRPRLNIDRCRLMVVMTLDDGCARRRVEERAR